MLTLIPPCLDYYSFIISSESVLLSSTFISISLSYSSCPEFPHNVWNKISYFYKKSDSMQSSVNRLIWGKLACRQYCLLQKTQKIYQFFNFSQSEVFSIQIFLHIAIYVKYLLCSLVKVCIFMLPLMVLF